MGIADSSDQFESITEGWLARKLFTDRHRELRRFASYLNDDPPRNQILTFYGEGGNGKSLLLDHLREHFCKRFDPEIWARLDSEPDESFESRFSEEMCFQPIPSAWLDFSMTVREDERPQDCFHGLLMIRRELAGKRLIFPRFTYANLWYLKLKGQLTRDRVAQLFPAEEMTLLMQLLNDLSQSTYPSLALLFFKLFDKHFSQTLQMKYHRFKLQPDEIQIIERMRPELELLPQLPTFFAQDINESMKLDGAPKRLVLFFDTHEAFWRDLSVSWRYRDQRDEWLRRLLTSLDLKSGIVAVLSGQQRPKWPESIKYPIPSSYLDVNLVGSLSTIHALTYLTKVRQSSALLDSALSVHGLCDALTAYASEAPDQVHPYYLGLCVEVVAAAANRNVKLRPSDFVDAPELSVKGQLLVDRFLNWVDNEVEQAVRALAACRGFDLELYLKLGQALNYQATDQGFQLLTGLSFIRRANPPGGTLYRIHDLMRRLLHESDDAVTRRAHPVLEEHYRSIARTDRDGGFTALTEAIYHASHQDWKRGVAEWVETFERALLSGTYERCRALLDIRGELEMMTLTEYWQGRVGLAVGDYFAALARYEEAEAEFVHANSAFDTALVEPPDDVAAAIKKGRVLTSLGELQTQQSRHTDAEQSYLAALAACEDALEKGADYIDSHKIKARALSSLGDLHAQKPKSGAAERSYNDGLAACDAVLALAPSDIDAHNTKAIIFQGLGDLLARSDQNDAAENTYCAALLACDAALAKAPDVFYAFSIKGDVLGSLAELRARLKCDDAEQTFCEALKAYKDALARAPELGPRAQQQGEGTHMPGGAADATVSARRRQRELPCCARGLRRRPRPGAESCLRAQHQRICAWPTG